MSAEAELRAAAKEMRKAAKALQGFGDLDKRLKELLKRLSTAGQREAQTVSAKRITEQPVHSGQLPSKSNRPQAADVGKKK